MRWDRMMTIITLHETFLMENKPLERVHTYLTGPHETRVGSSFFFLSLNTSFFDGFNFLFFFSCYIFNRYPTCRLPSRKMRNCLGGCCLFVCGIHMLPFFLFVCVFTRYTSAHGQYIQGSGHF